MAKREKSRASKKLLARLKELFEARLRVKNAPAVMVSEGGDLLLLEGRKWLRASFDNEIGIDRNTHMRSGEKHAHVVDRNGNELYALTHDCKPSHGSKPFRLSKAQAEALEGEGFLIPKNRIVEAILIGHGKLELLLG